MQKDSDSLFPQNTRRSNRDGELTIKCRNGLWSVSGRDHAFVEAEARRYFWLYWDDGEYAEGQCRI